MKDNFIQVRKSQGDGDGQTFKKIKNVTKTLYKVYILCQLFDWFLENSQILQDCISSILEFISHLF